MFEHSEAVVLTEAQKEELERRWQAFEANPDEGEPWEDVRAQNDQAAGPTPPAKG